MKEKLVSVIVPIYNVEKDLMRCVDSILNQTYPHLEILLIDDGSTDSSGKLMDELTDTRVKKIHQRNSGQAGARNAGLDLAMGDYIIMVDSDDWIREDLVELCLTTAEEAQSDLILFTSYNVNQDGKKQYVPRKSGYLLTDAGSVPWNKFYAAKLLQDIRFPLGTWYEDLGMIPAVVLRAKNPVKLEEALYFYQTDRVDSQSNLKQDLKFLEVIPMLQHVEAEMKRLGVYTGNEQELEWLYMEHLVYRTVLRKIIDLESIKMRKEALVQVKQVLKQKFPRWKKNGYISGTGLTAKLKKMAVRLYLAGFVRLGDLIWKVPFEKRRQKTGF
ncbi:glycosyltransferase family 2 protein [Listeria kieliensis]